MEQEAKRMIYPYTLAAKFRNFPFKFLYKHDSVFRYWLFAVAFCAPIFYKIQKLTYSPENVKKFEEMKRKEEEEAAHHFDYH